MRLEVKDESGQSEPRLPEHEEAVLVKGQGTTKVEEGGRGGLGEGNLPEMPESTIFPEIRAILFCHPWAQHYRFWLFSAVFQLLFRRFLFYSPYSLTNLGFFLPRVWRQKAAILVVIRNSRQTSNVTVTTSDLTRIYHWISLPWSTCNTILSTCVKYALTKYNYLPFGNFRFHYRCRFRKPLATVFLMMCHFGISSAGLFISVTQKQLMSPTTLSQCNTPHTWVKTVFLYVNNLKCFKFIRAPETGFREVCTPIIFLFHFVETLLKVHCNLNLQIVSTVGLTASWWGQTQCGNNL